MELVLELVPPDRRAAGAERVAVWIMKPLITRWKMTPS